MAQLRVKDLRLGYEGKTVADDINFDVKPGDYWCIVGENGSGKSTLIRALLGLKKPLSGTITYGDGLAQNDLGWLPQQTEVQRDFPASVREIVRSGTLSRHGMHPFYTAQEKKRADKNMQRLGITDLADRSYRALSGGQQQRVLLARALCAADKLLLLDEPTAGLDPGAAEEFYKLIEKLNKEGVTVIMVTHDMDAADTYASHVLQMAEKPLFTGTKEDWHKLRHANCVPKGALQ